MTPTPWMRGLALAFGLALALGGAPAAQAQVKSSAPTGQAPIAGICFGALGGTCNAVTEANPLPVTGGGGGAGAATAAKQDEQTAVLAEIRDDTTPVDVNLRVGGGGASAGTGASGANTLRVVPASDGVIGLDARTTGGCTPGVYRSAASNNSTNIKASAATLCKLVMLNTTSTIYYVRLYNSASAPTCSSGTGEVAAYPVPADTTGAGVAVPIGVYGEAYSTGLGFCITGGSGSNDNTNAATGVFLNYSYK